VSSFKILLNTVSGGNVTLDRLLNGTTQKAKPHNEWVAHRSTECDRPLKKRVVYRASRDVLVLFRKTLGGDRSPIEGSGKVSLEFAADSGRMTG
jgi:hypothetical protein